jgi:glycerol-1-phosphate dehydrogenase [NAD(P)+]
VAVGALFASFLREDGAAAELDAALARHGVPRVPRDLGLENEQFAAAVQVAPSTRPDRYTILEHLAMDEDEIRNRVDEFVDAFDR